MFALRKPSSFFGGRVSLELFLSIVSSVALLLFVWRYVDVYFASNDDTSIAKTLMGYYDGVPTAYHAFISGVLGRLLAGISHVFPNISWFSWFHIFSLFLACTFIVWCIIRLCTQGGIALPFCVALGFLFCSALILYPMGMLQFTTTSAALATGSTALQLIQSTMKSQKRWKYIFLDFISICLLFLSFCLRKDVFYVGLIFFLMAAFWKLYSVKSQEKPMLKETALITLGSVTLLIVLIGLSALYDQHLIRSYHLEEYIQWNKARALYMDYPHVTFENAPELYKSVNWSGSLYRLVNNWYFIEDGIDFEAFNTLNEATSIQTGNITLGGILVSIQKSIIYFASEEGVLYISIGLLMLLVAIVMLELISDKRNWVVLIMTGIIFFMVGLLSCYLVWKGRMLYRAAFPYLLPSALLLITMVLTLLRRETSGRKRLASRILLGMVALGFGLMSVFAFRLLHDGPTIQSYQWNTFNYQTVEDYAVENPETIVIFDVSLSGDLKVFPHSQEAKRPVNVFLWGGSVMHDATYNRRLQKLGVESLNSRLFMEGKAVYATDISAGYAPMMIDYMKKTYGDNIQISSKQVGFVMIYEFRPAED